MEKDNVNDYEIQVESRIPNDAALIRRANKMIDDFNLYPTMPTGDLSFEFIANVTKFNPLFVLNQLRKNIIDMLMDKTDFMYDEQQFDYILNETFYKRLKSQQERILLILIDNYKVDMQRLRGTYHSYMDLRQDETVVFYYAYSIYYIAQKLENASALIFARKVLKFLELFHCEKSSTPYDGLPANGKMFSIRRFKEDKQLYNEILDLIEVAIHKYADAEDERNLKKIQKEEKKTELKGKSKKVSNIFLRIIVTLCNPFLLYLSSTMFDFSEFDEWIPGVSGIILFFIALMFNIRVRNAVGVILFNIVLAAMFYPFCWLVAWVSLFALLAIILVVIGFFNFTIGGKT